MNFSSSLKPLVSAALLAAAPAFAVDGVTLIDQSGALAGNVTPGDAPGFPVTISRPGSYRLASNLSVPNGNTTAIEIGASHVTLDLNGFAILGPTNCSSGFPCAGAGQGIGVRTIPQNTSRFNTTVRNGTVHGMGASGIYLYGDSNLVEHVSVRSNGASGIVINANTVPGASTVRHSNAQRNGASGISVSGRADLNTASGNNGIGIVVGRGTASNNISTRNRDYGLSVGFGNYFGNSLSQNQYGGVVKSGAVNQGQNFCDNAPCPGAQL